MKTFLFTNFFLHNFFWSLTLFTYSQDHRCCYSPSKILKHSEDSIQFHSILSTGVKSPRQKYRRWMWSKICEVSQAPRISTKHKKQLWTITERCKGHIRVANDCAVKNGLQCSNHKRRPIVFRRVPRISCFGDACLKILSVSVKQKLPGTTSAEGNWVSVV